MKRSKIVGGIFAIAMVYLIIVSMYGAMPTPAGAQTFSPGDVLEVQKVNPYGLHVLGPDYACGPEIRLAWDGDRGTVLDGPVYCAGHWRWKIRWANDCKEGWSAEGDGTEYWLKKVYVAPSTRFTAGDRVRVINMGPTYKLHLRYNPPQLPCDCDRDLVWRDDGDVGRIIGGPYYGIPECFQCVNPCPPPPQECGNCWPLPGPKFYHFWHVDWDDGVVGWVAEGEPGGEDYLELCPTPGTPSNPSPSDDATCVSINADLDWADSTYATSYDVYFGPSSSPPYYDSTSFSSYSLPTLSYDTHYYWKILAKNDCGTTWGLLWDFTTTSPDPIPPSNPSPSDGDPDVSINADLDWFDCSYADSYDVYFGTSSSPPYYDSTSSSSYSLPTLDYNTRYYWKIIAKNDCGGTTSGPDWDFKTGICLTPDTPSNPSPSDDAPCVSINADLNWSDCSYADSYDVYFGPSSSPPYYDSTSSSSYSLPTLDYNTHYYWKILAKNDCGTTWGLLWDFTTTSPDPTTPSNPSPSDNATYVSIYADLDWFDCSYADSYDVYFGIPSSPPYYDSTSSSSYSLPTLDYNTHYYWQILAKNDCGTTPGPVWDFTTEVDICPTPAIPIPEPTPIVTEFPICTTTDDQWHPAISGDIAVWYDWRTGDSDIYGYDIISETEFSVCAERLSQDVPDISGDIIVWQDERNAELSIVDIYGYDLSTGTDFPISTNLYRQEWPAISEDFVVWRQQHSGSNLDIYGYDLSTDTEFPIYTDPATQEVPAVSGNIVVWYDNRNGNWDIYGYDVSNQAELPICTNPSQQQRPAVSGNIVVWYDDRCGNWDIFGYDLSTDTEFPICTGPAHQSHPAISGKFVVWTDNRNGNEDIYGYDLSTNNEFPICTNPANQRYPDISGDTVVWMDQRNGNWDIYGARLESTPTPGDGCFIAKAAYGTSTAGELDTLRAFRDEVLLQTSLGSRLVDLYYEVSPPVADFISEHEGLRTLVRELLVEPVVWVVDAIGTLWRD